MKIMKNDTIVYIAANKFSPAFDSVSCSLFDVKKAITKLKRRNSPDWKDCVIWYVTDFGERITVYSSKK